jgi:restriction system protein
MIVSNLDGYEFEKLISELLKKMGFSIEHTSLSGDNGVDIIAHSNQPIIKGKYIVQCKRWSNPIGEPVIRDLCGAMLNERGTKGIVIYQISSNSME